jgi:hypothetical protein
MRPYLYDQNAIFDLNYCKVNSGAKSNVRWSKLPRFLGNDEAYVVSLEYGACLLEEITIAKCITLVDNWIESHTKHVSSQ